MMAPTVVAWQAEFDDPDFAADYQLMLMLRGNLKRRCVAVEPIEPVQFDGGCMAI